MKIRPYVPISLILLAGFGLRLYRLGAQSLWYDETVSAVLAQKAIPDLIAHTARDIHPPGYYLLLRLWTRPVGETEFALGLFSVLFGMLLVAGLYHVGRAFFGPSVGLWTAGLVALSPYNLWYSQEVRMYTLGAFLGLAAVYFALLGVGRLDPGLTMRISPPLPQGREGLRPPPGRGRAGEGVPPWPFYTLSAALGLYTLYYFAFLLIPLNLYLLARLLRPRNRPALRPWLLANAAIVILYLPWLGAAYRQAANPPVPPWRSHLPLLAVLSESWTALSLGESVEPRQVWPLLILTLALFGLGLALANPLWRVLLPLLVFGPLAVIYLAPLMGLTGGPLYHARYLFTYSPPFYLTLGLALAWLWTRQKLVTALIALLLLAGAAISIRRFHADPAYAADDLRGAVNFIHQKWRPGDVVLINAGYAYTAFQYYFPEPPDQYLRLTNFSPDDAGLAVLQTGMVDGPPSLGWGDPASDFYAMSSRETIAALETVTQTRPRLWMLRLYDTVTDPDGLIRDWLAEHTTPFEDRLFTGQANLRVQGFMSRQPFEPPQAANLTLEDRFILRGFSPPPPQARAGRPIDVALWWEKQPAAPAGPPYALSLKLWDSQGNLAAQTEPDEWPAGNLYFTPDWQPDQTVYYPLRLNLPPDIEPDQYWLNVVFYNTQTGRPLQVNETGQTVILLGGVEVVE